MKTTKLAYLAAGYLAGLVLAFKYTKHPSPDGIAREIAKMHSQLWTETEKRLFSLQNREAVQHIFDAITQEISVFQNDAQQLANRLMIDGKKSYSDVLEKLSTLEKNREELIDDTLARGKKYISSSELFSEEIQEQLTQKLDTFAQSAKTKLTEILVTFKK